MVLGTLAPVFPVPMSIPFLYIPLTLLFWKWRQHILLKYMPINIYQTTQHHSYQCSGSISCINLQRWSSHFRILQSLFSLLQEPKINKLDVFIKNTTHVQWNICSGDLKFFTNAIKQFSVCYAATTLQICLCSKLTCSFYFLLTVWKNSPYILQLKSQQMKTEFCM
jgi:hypothetical protein